MKTLTQKIFFGKGIYLLIAEFLLLTGLTVKYYLFDELNVDDGKTFYNLILILLSITGAYISFKRMRDWGGYRSKVGKVLLFYGLGFLAWTIGTIIWAYYYFFLDNTMPYPSWADLAYVLINPCWIIGLSLFGYITALKNQQYQIKQKLYFFFIPICMALVTFYLIFILGHDSDISNESGLKLFLDFYYTGGDIVQLVVLMLVSGTAFNYLGERLRLPFILIVSSLLVSYVGDSLYTYSTSVGTYLNGDITDFLFTLLLFLVSLGAYTLHPHLLEDKE